ncbi:IucB [Klebsiella pneumoniae]|nr:IucB [Klebsiella pneumoniae]
MSKANIVHSGYGLRCERLDKPLNLSWGLDNSAVLRWPGPLPTEWLRDALDQDIYRRTTTFSGGSPLGRMA